MPKSAKKTSKKTGSGKYSHVKTGQTVVLANGACAKRLSNGRFQFVKKTSCKAKRGQWKRATQNGGSSQLKQLFDAIDDQEVDDINEVLEGLNKTDLEKLLSRVFSYHSDFDKKKNKPRLYPLTAIQFAATTTADDVFKVLLDYGADPYAKVQKTNLDVPFNIDTKSYVGLNSFEIVNKIDSGVYYDYFKKYDTNVTLAPPKKTKIDRSQPKKINKPKIMELRKKYETKPMDLYESVGTMGQDSPDQECDTNLSNQLCMDSFIYQVWFSVSEFVNTGINKNIVYERLLTQNDLIDIVKEDKDVFVDESTFPKGYYDKLIQQTARFYDQYMN